MNVFEGWKVTSPYGYRSDPFTGGRVFHTGIDLVKYHKYPIPAFVGGVVLFAGEGVAGTGFGGYGNVVALRDEKGHVHCYCHLDSVAARKGLTISKGDIIGYQGTTGRSTGSHLHYEIRAKDAPSYGYGSHVDPGEYLEQYYENSEEDEDSMTIKADDWVWKQIYNILGAAYNEGKIDWQWCQKVLDRTLTAWEYTHVLAVIEARTKGVDVDSENPAAVAPDQRRK
ncbi:M23 family metallopeptidase [Paenibacillus ehimensis]|uniref:M23 family metallopeptidase n=1 Tax=Paenibacillus ehimensis TaxID=79264 RepID=A0ABT8VI57_9BACL|nr:M23 family metallopeptidase [Paenibacillus ehimensis]MDO3680653.1 M23 family metallopeptidase [Paenibacillus ehimensis]